MSRYTAVNSTSSSAQSRRSSFHSLRRPSFSSFRFTRQSTRMPDPDEMDAAFDGPPDDEDASENHGLLGNAPPGSAEAPGRIPGDYDFERDYTLPPSSPPPFQPYSSHHPAPGNTNGVIPTSTPIRPTPQRHFLGGLLPTSLLPRQPSPAAGVVGAGNSGIFRNLAARPAPGAGEGRRDGPEYVPEDEQKDGPPSYQAALRDAVPPYWDTTVVLPSHNSPFGPLTSSLSGDEILIDGMPTGNFFGFVWNMIVSASFQFVGFLLTYVLHTTHSAKYGSRVGLGITLLQFGFSLRSRAEELIQTGQFPSDPSDPTVSYPNANEDEIAAGNAIAAFYGPNSPWPQPFPNLDDPAGAPVIINSLHEAEMYASAHNQTLVDILRLPSPQDVGRANEWFSFVLMSMGWFIVLTSLGGLWRVKRFERGLKRAQRESEEAQAAANRGEGEVPEDITTTPSSPSELGPGSLAYYTTVFNQYYQGAREIQRGFFGMNGRRLGGGRRGEGHAPLPSDGDDVELFDADRFERPMASNGGQSGRRGLWGL